MLALTSKQLEGGRKKESRPMFALRHFSDLLWCPAVIQGLIEGSPDDMGKKQDQEGSAVTKRGQVLSPVTISAPC